MNVAIVREIKSGGAGAKRGLKLIQFECALRSRITIGNGGRARGFRPQKWTI